MQVKLVQFAECKRRVGKLYAGFDRSEALGITKMLYVLSICE